MYLTGLPEELLDAICQQTDVLAAPEYVALARCCRAFRRVAHHHLYRRLLVSSSKHNLHLIPRLAKSRELASLVRDLTVSIANPTTNVFRTFYQMLAIALCNTTQLVHLTLDVAPDASWVLPSRALHEHSPLIHFASSFPLDVHVTQFIQTTPRLLHIKLGSMQSNSTGSLASMASCCPHQLVPLLSSFEGSVHDARTLVPGHPITVAHLHGPVPVHMIPLLAHSTSNIQVLSVTTSSPLTALLPALIEHLPELTRLQIATTSPNNAFNDEPFCKEIDNALRLFKALESFDSVGPTCTSFRRRMTPSVAVSEENVHRVMSDAEVNESSGLTGPDEYAQFFSDW